MSVETYDLMVNKTYAPENAAACDAAKDAYFNIKKPIEYYAIEILDDNKYRLLSLSANNTVSVVADYNSIEEVDKAVNDIYRYRKNPQNMFYEVGRSDAKILIVEPKQLRLMQYEEEHGKHFDNTYRIEPVQQQDAAEGVTHTLNRYNTSGGLDACLACGDYWQCNHHLDNILKMHEYGYSWDGIEPIFTVERALDKLESGETVYLLYEDNTESLAETNEQIKAHKGLFGRERIFPDGSPLFLCEIKDEIISSPDNSGRK